MGKHTAPRNYGTPAWLIGSAALVLSGAASFITYVTPDSPAVGSVRLSLPTQEATGGQVSVRASDSPRSAATLAARPRLSMTPVSRGRVLPSPSPTPVRHVVTLAPSLAEFATSFVPLPEPADSTSPEPTDTATASPTPSATSSCDSGSTR